MAHLFLLFSTTILLFLHLPTTLSTKPVLDTMGNPLQVGTPYYIRTAVSQFGIGGGVVVGSKPNQPECPQYAGHLRVGFYNEAPVMFYPSNSSEKFIHVNSDVSIVFKSTSSPCPQGAWKLTPDANSGEVLISTGGDLGSPKIDSLFKIVYDELFDDDYNEEEDGDYEFESIYQLRYCPNGRGDDIICGVIRTVDVGDDFDVSAKWDFLGLAQHRDSYFAALSFIKAN